MQRFFPIALGFITLVIFGGIGLLFWSEGRTYWAALFGVLTVIRGVVWIRQTRNILSPYEDDDDDDEEARSEADESSIDPESDG